MEKIQLLEKASEEVVKFLKENCSPYDTVVITSEQIRLVSDSIGIPVRFVPETSGGICEGVLESPKDSTARVASRDMKVEIAFGPDCRLAESLETIEEISKRLGMHHCEFEIGFNFY